MFAVARSLRLVVGLAFFAAIQSAAAQAPSTHEPGNVRTRGDCPVESHPVAINPDVVECHARFAPLPTIPPEFERGNPEHLEILRAKGDVLLRQLDRPEACGKTAKLRPNESCAILVYVINPEFRQAGLPWTFIVKIFRTSHPAEGRLRETVLYTVLSNDSEGTFGPVGGTDEVWKLLADQRATIRCKPAATEFVRNSGSAAGKMSRPNTCRHMGEDVRYHPVLLIGWGEAKRVLNPVSIRRNFDAPLFEYHG